MITHSCCMYQNGRHSHSAYKAHTHSERETHHQQQHRQLEVVGGSVSVAASTIECEGECVRKRMIFDGRWKFIFKQIGSILVASDFRTELVKRYLVANVIIVFC